MEISNEELSELFDQDRDQVIRWLFNTYYKRLCYFAAELIRSPEDAEEIVSTTILKLWQQRGNFDSEQKIKAWLYISVRNACYNFLRSGKQNKTPNKIIDLASDLLDDHATRLYQKSEIGFDFSQIISKLPERQREIMDMALREELSTKEIAEKLQISEATVRSTMRHALDKLRKMVGGGDLLLLIIVLKTLESRSISPF